MIFFVAILIIGALVWRKFAERTGTPTATATQGVPAPLPAPAPAAKPTPQLPPLLEPEAQVFAKYAGSQSCRGCHAAQFESWAKSNHGMAERLPSDALDAAAFSPERTFHHGTQDSTATKIDGKPAVKTLGFDNKHEAYKVARVIGHDPLRQYLVEGPRDGSRRSKHPTIRSATSGSMSMETRIANPVSGATGRGAAWGGTRCVQTATTRGCGKTTTRRRTRIKRRWRK